MKVLLHRKIKTFTFFCVYFHPSHQDIMLTYNVFFKDTSKVDICSKRGILSFTLLSFYDIQILLYIVFHCFTYIVYSTFSIFALSIHPCIHPCIHPPIHPCIHLSLCLLVDLYLIRWRGLWCRLIALQVPPFYIFKDTLGWYHPFLSSEKHKFFKGKPQIFPSIFVAAKTSGFLFFMGSPTISIFDCGDWNRYSEQNRFFFVPKPKQSISTAL